MSIRYFCVFIGHPRNGSSILGGLLDAHPHVTISHEIDVMNRLKNQTKETLYQEIIDNAKKNAETGRKQSGYSAFVPNSWQGKDKEIRIIGDKKADWTALHLLNNPKKLDMLQDIVNIPIKFIHTIRNPFDNIATIFKRKERHKTYTISKGEGNMADGVIGFYFNKCIKGIVETKQRVLPENWCESHHEKLVANPKEELTRILKFLGEDSSDEYLQSCKEVLFPKAKITRSLVEWKPNEVRLVEDQIKNHPFLSHYSFAGS